MCAYVCVCVFEREMTYIAGRILSESCSILFEETISPGAELARLRKWSLLKKRQKVKKNTSEKKTKSKKKTG